MIAYKFMPLPAEQLTTIGNQEFSYNFLKILKLKNILNFCYDTLCRVRNKI